MQKAEIALILTLATLAAWPWLKRLFTWKSALVLALGGGALWRLVKT